MSPWTHDDSKTLYNVHNWGRDYFGIDPHGHVLVRPEGPDRDGPTLDIYELIGQIRRRGVSPPILLRFDGILRARVRQVVAAFDNARQEFGYDAPYCGVYPIKVNQERHVVEALLSEGHKQGFGLEVGSKPELIAVMALQAGEGSLMICNGYKDEDYVEMALLASKLGITPIIVIEKMSELDTVLAASRRLGIRPVLGVRTKLAWRGAGRWSDSGGDRSKFGLTTREIVTVVKRLREAELLDTLELLHFHLGSQITAIRSLKDALREATQTLVGLARMGVRTRWFDVGGGLGVDYDGSSTDFESSVNYTLQEYANDVVYHLAQACAENEVEQPTIVTESGRALVAHHAVLVTEVLGTSEMVAPGPPTGPPDDAHETVRTLSEIHATVTAKNFQESYHDAVQLREEAMLLFNVGQLVMEDRALIEEWFWRTCDRILRVTRGLDYVPDDLAGLERDMADTYFLNFSLFQSVPDSWAIHQLFPILPLHRHREEPTRRAVLADITCDSDGKVDRFIDLRDVKRVLELHPLRPGEPYYLGFFLVGAYQEILGDMHNLFGDTNTVHVDLDAQGRPKLTHIVRGDRVHEVLGYVEYHVEALLARVRHHLERALEAGRIEYEDSAQIYARYEAALNGYTYLERERGSTARGGSAPASAPTPVTEQPA